MARLVWHRQEDRKYEYGVSHGVFYEANGDGVAWPGLTSVTESREGGSVTPLYFEGRKVHELIRPSEFSATIEAFSAPTKFDPCQGIKRLVPGFLVTRQPRETFHFSYRTKIGGYSESYIINLVYNATATKNAYSYSTDSDSVSISNFNWKINAVPPAAVGYRPTAHIQIVASKQSGSKFADLENLLYGYESGDAYLPAQSEVIEMLSSIFGGTPESTGTGILFGGTPESAGSGLVSGGAP